MCLVLIFFGKYILHSNRKYINLPHQNTTYEIKNLGSNNIDDMFPSRLQAQP
jgi:hypothetical protein